MGPVRGAARAVLGSVAVVMALLGLVAVGAPASAQEYGGICSVAAVYDSEAGELRVIGEGLAPGFTTPIVLDGENIGSAVADGSGNFDVVIEVALTEGLHSVAIVCDLAGIGSESQVLVLAEGSAPVHVVDPTTIDCNGTLRGFAEGALPGLSVTFTINQGNILVATVVADADGRAEYSRRINLAPGNYTVTSRGRDVLGDEFELTVGFTVRRNCPTPTTLRGTGTGTGTGSAGIPRTGSDAGPAVATGLGAIAAGAFTVAVARRRRLAAG